MTRRRLLLLAAAACLLLAGPFLVRWAMMPAPGVTLENFRRLHDGMTFDQIKTIFGEPVTKPDEHWRPGRIEVYMWPERTAVSSKEAGGVTIFVHGNHVMCGWFWWPNGKEVVLATAPESFADMIRRWLRL